MTELTISRHLLILSLLVILLTSGLGLLGATARGWQGPRRQSAWDVFGVQRRWTSGVAGSSPTRYYRLMGWLFTLVGATGLALTLWGGE